MDQSIDPGVRGMDLIENANGPLRSISMNQPQGFAQKLILIPHWQEHGWNSLTPESISGGEDPGTKPPHAPQWDAWV